MRFITFILLFSLTSILAIVPAKAEEPIPELHDTTITVQQEQDRVNLFQWNMDAVQSVAPATFQPKPDLHKSKNSSKWGFKGEEAYSNFPNIFIQNPSYAKRTIKRHKVQLTSRSGLLHRNSKLNLTPIIMKYAKEYDLDPNIIRSIIEIESSYNPSAISVSGACGLMQLKPATARDMGVVNYWDPEQNVKGGARYISLMLQKFGTLDLALAAYNQGPGRVQRAGNQVPNSSAQNYIDKFYRTYTKK